MSWFFSFSGLLNFILALFLGVLVYLKGRKQFQDISFALYFFSVAFWSFGYFFWQISTEENMALFWSRFLMAGAIFIPIFYFHFIVSFLNLVEKYKKLLYLGYGLSSFFSIVNFTPYFVRSVEPELFFPFWPKPGIFFHPFLLMFFSFVVYGWYLLLKTLRETKEIIRKQQIKYFLLGTGVGFIGGSTNYFLWYDILIPPYGNILVIFGIVLVAFAVLKYHLFEIRVILTEILVGVMGIILLILPFVMPTSSLKILTGAVFLLFCIFAYYLIKATHEEAKRREEAEKIAIREKALREKAEKLAKEFERIAKIKDQMLLSSQHYWRTPLTGIIGYLEMILEGTYGKLSPVLKEKLTAIQNLSQELHQRIEESIEITQFQIGKGTLELKKVQIEDLVKKVLEIFQPQIEQKGLYLKKDLTEGPLPKIKLDPKRIFEVFSNIIDNAIKHTEKGGITIGLRFLKEKFSILFLVRDTGIGIPKEELASLGKSLFERGKLAKELSPMGKGIGLYLSNLIVQAHGGKLWAESEGPGKGSTFYVELPVK